MRPVCFTYRRMEDEDIKCPVCKNTFNDTDCVPKFLHCYHTFCRTCLKNVRKVKKARGKVTFSFICPTCKIETWQLETSSLQTNNIVLKLLTSRSEIQQLKAKSRSEVEQLKAESRSEIEQLKAKSRSEVEQLKAEAEFYSKWCSTCSKMANASCGGLSHLLVEIEEERKLIPCTKYLENLKLEVKRKSDIILDERKKVGEFLRKAENHLKLVLQQLYKYMKSNEEQSTCVSLMRDDVLPILSTKEIAEYESKYEEFLRLSTVEITALKNIVKQAETIDGWGYKVDNYQFELEEAQEEKQEFGERSPWLFKSLLDLMAASNAHHHVERNTSHKEPSQLRHFVSVLCEDDDFESNLLPDDTKLGEFIWEDFGSDSEEEIDEDSGNSSVQHGISFGEIVFNDSDDGSIYVGEEDGHSNSASTSGDPEASDMDPEDPETSAMDSEDPEASAMDSEDPEASAMAPEDPDASAMDPEDPEVSEVDSSDQESLTDLIVNRCAWSRLAELFALAVRSHSVSKVFILHHDWMDASCHSSRFEIVEKILVGPETVVSLAWNAPGSTIATATSKGRLLLWNKDDRCVVNLPRHTSHINHLKWNHLGNDSYLLTACDKRINVWNSTTLDLMDSYYTQFDGSISQKDHSYCVENCDDIPTLSSVIEWISSNSFSVCLNATKISIHSIGLNEDRSTTSFNLPVSSSEQFVEIRPLLSQCDGKLRITTLHGGTCTSSDKFACGSARICFSDKPLDMFTNIISSVIGDYILLYDTDTDLPIKLLDVGGKVESCCFSADGSKLATVHTSVGSFKGSLSVFCTKTWQTTIKRAFKGHFNASYMLDWNAASNKVAVVCDRVDAIPDVLFFAV